MAGMPCIMNDNVADEEAMAGPSASEPMDVEESNAPGETLPTDSMHLDDPPGFTSELAAQAADQPSEVSQHSGTDIGMDVERDQDEEMPDESLSAGGMHQDSYGSTAGELYDRGSDAFNRMPDIPNNPDLESNGGSDDAQGIEHANASNEMLQYAEDMDTNEQGDFAGGVAPRYASNSIETPQAEDVDMAGSHDVADNHGSVNATAPVEKRPSKEIEMEDAVEDA
jgi:hypothetical protein